MAAPPNKPNQASLFGEEPDDDSFWLKLMAECLENPVTKLPAGRQLLVLGDNEAEKTLLITKLQGGGATAEVNFTKGNGLEYRYLTVKDEYCDSHTKLGVWILDGDPFYRPLLKYALDRSTSLADTTVMLVASMTKPWDIMDTLVTWTDILREHIERQLPAQELESARTRVLERFREYVEPGLSIYGSLAADNTRELEVNLGVEMIVVVTKTEYMRELQTEFGYEEEHFDFIQLSLREFCMSRGAALFYVSVKEDKNCDVLLKYILHRTYPSFPFRLPGVLVERDSILVPAGWDTKNKIRFLSETLTTIPSSTPYEEVVFKPARLSDIKRSAPEIVAQRNQEFLAEMQTALERQASEVPDASKDNNGSITSSMTATVVQRNVARRMTRAQPGVRSPQKKMEAKLVSGEGDNTLSNFFHSLLNRRTSAPVDRPLGFTGTRTLAQKVSGGQSEHNLTRNISTTVDCRASSRQQLLQEISEQQHNCNRKCSEEGDSCSENDSENDGADPKPKSTHSLSLDSDQGDSETAHQLPEYFLSNPGGGEGLGPAPDCCSFQPRDPASSYDYHDLDDDSFSPPLDRVRSSFNPPLKQLLLENGGETSEGKNRPYHKEAVANGGLKNGNAAEFSSVVIKPDSMMSTANASPSTTMPCKMNNTSNHDQNSVAGT